MVVELSLLHYQEYHFACGFEAFSLLSLPWQLVDESHNYRVDQAFPVVFVVKLFVLKSPLTEEDWIERRDKCTAKANEENTLFKVFVDDQDVPRVDILV